MKMICLIICFLIPNVRDMESLLNQHPLFRMMSPLWLSLVGSVDCYLLILFNMRPKQSLSLRESVNGFRLKQKYMRPKQSLSLRESVNGFRLKQKYMRPKQSHLIMQGSIVFFWTVLLTKDCFCVDGLVACSGFEPYQHTTKALPNPYYLCIFCVSSVYLLCIFCLLFGIKQQK